MAPKNNSPFPPGSLICAYLRDSGGDDQDLSVPQQEASIRAWCNQHGLALAHIFADAAAPGSSVVGRANFLKMIQHFRAPGCHEAGLVIWKFSRFARDIDDSMFYKSDLRRMGYIIHSITDDIPQGIDGRFFEAARDWMNEKFLQDLSEDVKRGLAHLVQTYGAVPGVPPTGFTREPIDLGKRRDGSPHIVHRWVPDPDLWALCRKAWLMRARHATYAQIHAATHVCGSLNSYSTFFSNRLYLGELHFSNLVIPNYCEPLIDQETWDAVQAIAKDYAAQVMTQRHRENSRYLLSGLAYCARCGSPLNGHTIQFKGKEESYDYYRCSRATRRRDCDSQQIPRQALEELVIETLKDEILSPHTIHAHQVEIERDRLQEAERKAAERLELLKQLNQVKRRLANVVETLANVGSSPTLNEKLLSLEADAVEIQSQIDGLAITPIQTELSQNQVAAQVARLHELLGTHHAEALRLVLHGLIAKIVVEREDRAVRGLVTYYHPPEMLTEGGEFMFSSKCPHVSLAVLHKFTTPFSFIKQPSHLH